MTVSKSRSFLIALTGIVLLLVGVGVGWWAWGGGAGERDSRGTTFGTLLAVLGLAFTLVGWFIPTTGERPVKETAQQAGPGSVQSGGQIVGAVATGYGADATAPAPAALQALDAGDGSSNPRVKQRAGAGAVQAAGDITGAVATGKNARAGRRTQLRDEADHAPHREPPGNS